MSNIFDIINVPLGMLIKFIYTLTSNYAITLFLFALIVKAILFPLGIKQQKGQIKMKKMQPKEQAIRKKYAGRSDSATQQKMQSEIMALYKTENYSPMAGCLPMLIQLPIIWALYSIIRNPLTYISTLSTPVLENLKTFIFENFNDKLIPLFKTGTEITLDKIDQIKLVRLLDDGSILAAIKTGVEGMADFKNIDFTMFGKLNLTDIPSEVGFSLLLIIPLLNLVFSFLQTRITKIYNQNPGTAEQQNNMSMKIMEYTMPLLIVYMAYTWYSALGLYWIYQSVLGIAQTIILAKMYPMPVISEAEYKEAEALYGTKKKKKKKIQTDEDGNLLPETTDSSDLIETEFEESDETPPEKYVSDNFKGGVNNSIKKNYNKTGKKYTVKRKKD